MMPNLRDELRGDSIQKLGIGGVRRPGPSVVAFSYDV